MGDEGLAPEYRQFLRRELWRRKIHEYRSGGVAVLVIFLAFAIFGSWVDHTTQGIVPPEIDLLVSAERRTLPHPYGAGVASFILACAFALFAFFLVALGAASTVAALLRLDHRLMLKRAYFLVFAMAGILALAGVYLRLLLFFQSGMILPFYQHDWTTPVVLSLLSGATYQVGRWLRRRAARNKVLTHD